MINDLGVKSTAKCPNTTQESKSSRTQQKGLQNNCGPMLSNYIEVLDMHEVWEIQKILSLIVEWMLFVPINVKIDQVILTMGFQDMVTK